MFWFVVSLVVAAEPSVAQLQKQCEAKKASACRELGQALSVENKSDKRPAYAAYVKGCALRDAAACNFAGVLLVEGVGMARDVTEAERLFHLACEQGLSTACLNEGMVLNDGDRDGTPSLRRAFELAKVECDAGDLEGCRAMLRASEAAKPPLLKPTEAVKMVTRACNLGADWACGTLALANLGGYGLEENPAEAKRLGAAACAKNDKSGCEVMALIAAKASDWPEASRTAAIACDGEHPIACFVRGSALLGKGAVKADYPKAAEAFELSCGHGYEDACVTLFAFSSKLKVEGERLEHIEDRACRADRPAACKKVLARSKPPPAELLEHALESVCGNATGPFSNEREAADACEQLAERLESKGSPKLAKLYAVPCRLERYRACEKLAALPDAKVEEHGFALSKLCRPEEKKWCVELVPLLEKLKVEPKERVVPLALACVQTNGPECAQLEATARDVKDSSYLTLELDPLCTPERPRCVAPPKPSRVKASRSRAACCARRGTSTRARGSRKTGRSARRGASRCSARAGARRRARRSRN